MRARHQTRPFLPLLLVAFGVTVNCTQPYTHICRLHLDASSKQHKASSLACVKQPHAPADCHLCVYYNSSSGRLEDGVTPLAGLIKPPFGDVRADKLPSPRAQWHSAAFNRTEPALNRTEPLWNATSWPPLYFHGGPSCKLLLPAPFVKGVQLPIQDGEGTQVLSFGGGLEATLQGGSISNTAAYMGVWVLANGKLTLLSTQFINNTVRRGTAYASWASQLTINGATFEHNRADSHGGAVYLVGSRGLVVNTTIRSNVAVDGGGGVYVKGGSSVELQASTLVNNTSPTGGALAVYDSSKVSVTQRSQVCNNTARMMALDASVLGTGNYYKLGVGGAMYLQESDVAIIDSNVSSNTAVTDGGGIRMLLGQLRIVNSSLSFNQAYRHGGALYVGMDNKNDTASGSLVVLDSLLQNNTAQAHGGAVMLERRVFSRFINTTIQDCKAWSDGAGICSTMAEADGDNSLREDLATTLLVDNVTFLGSGDKLFIGPYFNLQFNNSNLDRHSEGIVWRRRLCSRGEFVAPSQYCEECPSYQFSLQEGTPGHNRTQCDPAPSTAYAPGGATIVPLSGGWHGHADTVRACSDCPLFTASLGDIRRCPNPAACQHSYKALADQHPYSRNASRLTWPQYASLLCNRGEGYEGVLCGVCMPGFGQTAPFKCNRCLGVGATAADAATLSGQDLPQPGPGRISGLYLVYWFVLTCWLLLCVRSSALAPAKPSSTLRSPRPSSAALSPLAEHSTSDMAAAESAEAAIAQEQSVCSWKAGAVAAAAHAQGQCPKEVSRSLDITKALIVYAQWVMLIINLPVAWLPWVVAEGGNSRYQAFSSAVGGFVGVLFGRAASMDCFLQAWQLLQGDTVQQIASNVAVRAIGSAVVVPCALLLSVLLLQLLLSALRQPFLRTLERLCSRSEFCRRRLAGRLHRAQFGAGDLICSVTSAPVLCVEGGDIEAARGAPLSTASASSSSLPSVMSVGLSASTQTISGMLAPSSEQARDAFLKRLCDTAVATALAVSMFVYVSIARTAFGMLLCVRPGADAGRRWVLDVRLQCPTSPPHTGWGAAAVMFGVVLLVLCVAWPVGIAAVLIQAAHKGQLLRLGPSHMSGRVRGGVMPTNDAAAASTTARLAVRYADYDVAYEQLRFSCDVEVSGWYRSWALCKVSLLRLRLYVVLVWDSILDLHRLTISLVSLCVMLHELHQLILMVLVLGSYLLLVLLVKPWRSHAVFRLQAAALAILLASCLGIMACAAGDAGAYYTPQARLRYTIIIPWLVIAVNLGYLAFVVVLLIRCVCREAPRLFDLRAVLRDRFHLRRGR